MLILYINKQLAVIAKDTKIKLTRTNPAFSESGDYTLDVTLPLLGCAENLRIFGALHRPELPLQEVLKTKYEFDLLADSLSLTGVALIKSVTETQVKVQLVGGNRLFSVLAYDDKGVEKYIDELPLGMAYDTFFANIYPVDGVQQTREKTIELFYRSEEIANFMHFGDPYGYYNDGNRGFGGAECVCYPIYSVTDGDYANNSHVNIFAKITKVHPVFLTEQEDVKYEFPLTMAKDRPTGVHWQQDTPIAIPNTIALAPQPYLSVILERVLSVAYGLSLDQDDNALRWDKHLSRLFVANARITMEYAKTLPHWTISTFLREVCNFCGVEIHVSGKRVRVVKRSQLYQEDSNVIELDQILSEHTAEINSNDTSNDVSTANVGYSWTNIERIFSLPDEIWESARVKYVTNVQAVESATNITAEDRNTIYVTDDGRHYAYIDEQTADCAEINQGGPLIRRTDTRKIDIELKIIPCLMRRMPVPVAAYTREGKGAYVLSAAGQDRDHRPVLVTEDTRLVEDDEFKLWDAIADEQKKDNDKDVMEVATSGHIGAIHYHQLNKMPNFLHTGVALGFPYVSDPTRRTVSLAGTNSPEFILHATQGDAPGARLSHEFRLDTRIQYTFTFLSQQDLPPTAIYHIGTRRFVCDKIEMSIDNKGIAPVKTGYFYELL